jgi:hypothetical protein
MKIVCIAWGSLLWKSGSLILASGWQPGGPLLPLEFARDSDDSDELAIVIHEGAPLMPTFWAMLETGDLEQACEQLRQREKIAPEHPEWLGSVPRACGSATDARIEAWLLSRPASERFDAVVWTALPSKFAGVEGRAPDVEEAIAFLDGLEDSARETAEEYVRRTPAEIMTPYRRRFEEALGWTASPVL